jgi:hypothetical protein
LTCFQQQLRDGVTLVRNAIEPILNLINRIRDELDNVNRIRQERQEQEQERRRQQQEIQEEQERQERNRRQEEDLQAEQKLNDLHEDLRRRAVDEFDLVVRGLQHTTGAIVQAVARIRYIING